MAFRQIGISHYTEMFAVRKESAYITLFNITGAGNLPQTFVVREKSLGWWQDLPQGAKIWHQCIISHEHLLFFIVENGAAPPLTPYRPWGISPSLNGNPRTFLGLEYPRLREETFTTPHKLLLLLVQLEVLFKQHFSYNDQFCILHDTINKALL